MREIIREIVQLATREDSTLENQLHGGAGWMPINAIYFHTLPTAFQSQSVDLACQFDRQAADTPSEQKFTHVPSM